METHPINRLELLAFAINECTPKEHDRISAHIDHCAECQRELVRVREERALFLQEHPFRTKPAGGGGTETGTTSFWRPVYSIAASLLLMATAGWFISSQKSLVTERTKGDGAIAMYVQNDTGSIDRRKNNLYHPGEKVQITYSTSNANHLILVSIDTSGKISTYYPAQGDTSILVEKGHNQPLPNSIVLDSYVGSELYIAVFSTATMYLPDVKNMIIQAYTKKPDISDLALVKKDSWDIRTIFITKAE